MNNLEQQETNFRIVVALVASIIAAVFIGVMSLVFSPSEGAVGQLAMGDILFDRSTDVFPYPLTIQNMMWLLFMVGFGELWIRFDRGTKEMAQLKRGLLPEDDSTMLRAKELVPIFSSVVDNTKTRYFFLPRLMHRIILQFQNSQSINQSNSLMNSSLELMQHEIDLKYNMVRYLVWLIPTIGFIGTVIGIALSLSEAANMPDLGQSDAIRVWMGVLTTKLGVAFNTTLLALVMSAILVFFMHLAQGREESALNNTGQYCMDNLINRLYEEK
ncbi:MotA/TolQ/ExbB proton channel family protein [Haliea sp. AH-315-K21]|uniref:MotA/TolQ/ExbB proton channel domain-containing protein n=1 Tax=SAR86 cluster bacterium TaxID=2030880 RepID=A0A2A5CDJ4_9GAMM|nr:MotA/TolQ/ExbB proton channel family protein [Haliea sp. AH-315-K21]MBN4075496.1 MotA/TolQ/ExbB proton channel family protein [Gammaproteobacteria bacterium AH-315-E17]PCJ41832.1 MAG: hypothetical protein COA71_07420 [SAR86 cluster bacterium]PCJ43791.1 MAG: hypothetical protein COA71_02700 [SAR86 cluster bacterium]